MYWERAREAEASPVHPTAAVLGITQREGIASLHGSIQPPGDPLPQDLWFYPLLAGAWVFPAGWPRPWLTLSWSWGNDQLSSRANAGKQMALSPA